MQPQQQNFLPLVASHPVFGKQRLHDFNIDHSYTNTNHGSYGYTPKIVLSYKHQLQLQMQFNGQTWFRKDLQLQINQSRKYIAQKVNCPVKNLFLVQNSTDAFNGLMKSIDWKKGDIVLLPNTAYASIRRTLEWLRDRYEIVIAQLNFTSDDLMSQQKIQLKIQNQVNKFDRKIKYAVFDHISSTPAILFPIQTIAMFLEEKGIQLFVDGAHAMCQTDIDLVNLQCEAYFSNFHKWAFTPKNAAFIYLSDKYLDIVRPAITGNFRGQGIQRQYFWTGTRDCVSYLCVKKGIQYFQSFGINQVKNYNHYIVFQGAKVMASIWKTQILSPDEKCTGYISNVWLPQNDQKLCMQIQKELTEKYNTFLVITKFDGRMFCRICGQIYNQLEDYQNTAKWFLEILKRKKKEIQDEKRKKYEIQKYQKRRKLIEDKMG